MFLGHYPAMIDGKGRINIPSRHREILEEKGKGRLVLSAAKDCLAAYPQPEWQAMEEKWRELSTLRKDVRDFYRLFYARASECEMKHGRILIPPALRAKAGLAKEVVIAGVSRFIEIWDRAKWDKFLEEKEGQFDDLGNTLAEL